MDRFKVDKGIKKEILANFQPYRNRLSP